MAKVPRLPGTVGDTQLSSVASAPVELRAAMPVRGTDQWWSWSRAQAWLSGRGAQLVSMGPSNKLMSALSNSSDAVTFAAKPHKQHTCWMWILGLTSASGTASSGTFDGALGTELGSWSLPPHDAGVPHYFYFLETFPSMTVNYTNDFAANEYPVIRVDVGTYVYRTSLQAIEMPLADVDTIGSAERAVTEHNTATNGAPIYEPASGRKSIYGLTRAALNGDAGEGLIREARRCHLFSWEYDADDGGVTITDTAYPGTSQFFALPPTVLARHLYEGTTTGTVSIVIAAQAIGAPNTGEVRVTSTSGSSVTIQVNGVTAGWWSGNITVWTEDLSRNGTDGGIRSGARDFLTVMGRVTGGTTALNVWALYVTEPE